MTIGIIGAGFTGLAAAYYLSKAGHKVTVLERTNQPGGLATGFKEPNWDWTLEQHYHHFFVSDKTIQILAAEIGHPVHFVRPKTSTYYQGQTYQLDSPLSLLRFSPLPVIDRLRMGLVLAFLKTNPWWQPLESFTAQKFITMLMGQTAWEVLWEPLFLGKFGKYASSVSASWFWARINPRSPSLGYPQGGFLSLARLIESVAKKLGAKFIYSTTVERIEPLLVKYDRVICTLPTAQLGKISGLDYPRLPGLGAVNLVLVLDRQFLTDGTYWLNINDRIMPFVCVAEHTNFMDPKFYGGDHLLYIGNYLPADHPYFSMSAGQLVSLFSPYLKKINPKFKTDWIRKAWVFKAPFAQPVVTPGYSRHIPAMVTPIPNLYLANIQQVYPWDRGTNFAVVLGRRVADLCLK